MLKSVSRFVPDTTFVLILLIAIEGFPVNTNIVNTSARNFTPICASTTVMRVQGNHARHHKELSEGFTIVVLDGGATVANIGETIDIKFRCA